MSINRTTHYFIFFVFIAAISAIVYFAFFNLDSPNPCCSPHVVNEKVKAARELVKEGESIASSSGDSINYVIIEVQRYTDHLELGTAKTDEEVQQDLDSLDFYMNELRERIKNRN
jgi:hypothetical protein